MLTHLVNAICKDQRVVVGWLRVYVCERKGRLSRRKVVSYTFTLYELEHYDESLHQSP